MGVSGYSKRVRMGSGGYENGGKERCKEKIGRGLPGEKLNRRETRHPVNKFIYFEKLMKISTIMDHEYLV